MILVISSGDLESWVNVKITQRVPTLEIVSPADLATDTGPVDFDTVAAGNLETFWQNEHVLVHFVDGEGLVQVIVKCELGRVLKLFF